jgi:hypothetical protein
VVHVLTGVLEKVHKSLRPDGFVLITQPADSTSFVQLEIDGRIALREEFPEPNFAEYLRATQTAMDRVVQDHLFKVVAEVILPAGDNCLCDEYDSIAAWRSDYEPSCEDLDVFNELATRMQKVAGDRKHVVKQLSKERQILLNKSQPL